MQHHHVQHCDEKGRQWERALGLLEEMGCKGVQLDTITYNG